MSNSSTLIEAVFMVVYVDPLFKAVPRTSQAKLHGNQWCHLVTDGEIEELHVFAETIGLRRSWFQRSSVPHYDLTPSKRMLAVENGAIEVTAKELSPLRRSWMSRWHGGNPDWD